MAVILANPKALFWAGLAVPVILLYLRRPRPPRYPVSAGYLWEQVLGTSRFRSLWWWRRPISLCLQLTILMLLILALAEPLADYPRRVVLLIDTSASMGAADVKPTRLDRAKRLAQDAIAGLACRDQMAVLTAGDSLRVHCGLTSRKAVLQEALQNVPAPSGATRVTEAVALGRRLAADSPNRIILVLTDGCFDGAVELARQGDVHLIAIGTAADNAAVARLEARRMPTDPSRCQILVEVAGFSSQPMERRLQLQLDGRPIDTVPIRLAAGERWQQVFETTAATGSELTAALKPADCLAADDRASSRLPPPEARQATRIPEGGLERESIVPRNQKSPAPTWPALESDLRVPAELLSRQEPVPVSSGAFPLWPFPAALGLGLLVMEWCLFCRRWTC